MKKEYIDNVYFELKKIYEVPKKPQKAY
jgi:hypothetical protein